MVVNLFAATPMDVTGATKRIHIVALPGQKLTVVCSNVSTKQRISFTVEHVIVGVTVIFHVALVRVSVPKESLLPQTDLVKPVLLGVIRIKLDKLHAKPVRLERPIR